MRVIEPSHEILYVSENPLELIEAAGRTAYKSEDRITEESAPAFVRMILDRGHFPVTEFGWMVVRFVCDRGVSHEIVRHRLFSFVQESTRFCDYGKGKFGGELTFIMQPFWSQGAETRQEKAKYTNWLGSMACAEDAYLDLLNEGATPQQARSVLPNSLKTEIVCAANLREWTHFFRMRVAKAAHPQMRQLTVPLLREVKERIPVLFDDIEIPEADG
jgi:thymidylate synthase (FAD)